MATPEIKVKIGADTAGFDKGMGGVDAKLSTFAKAAGVAAAGAALALATGMIALTKASLANIDVLTKQARSLGLTTEAFQKMTLVAGEAGIETGKLSAMLGLMQRNISELNDGTQAQVDAFGRLGLSISDLQGLAPDAQFEKIAAALDSIADPTTKTALAMDVFGRSGREAINMLSDYGSKAAAAAEFQNRFGIAVSQSAAEGIERSNDAVARLGMVMTGLGNTMAGAVAPGLEATANALIAFAGAAFGAKVSFEEFFGSIALAKAMLGENIVNEMLGKPESFIEHAEAISGIAESMRILLTDTDNAAMTLEVFAGHLDKLGYGAAEVMAQVASEIRLATAEFEAGKIKADEFAARILAAKIKSDDLVASLDMVASARFGGLIADLGNLFSSLLATTDQAKELARSLPGNVDPGAVEFGPGPPRPAELGFQPDPNAPKTRPQQVGIDSVGNFNDANAPRGGGGGGGGGGGMVDMFAQRLEALQEGLATESEVVAEWYLEGQTTLEEALANKALTEAEYHDLRERLEEEHQNRLAGIRQIGNQSALNMALGAGEEILNAIGQTNAKALKVAKVFGAAQALISAYQGAAEALKLPFPANIAAAATVLAKGIGFVNAIRSVNSGGGGGGGGGAGGRSGASQSQAPAQTPLDVRLTGFGPNDLFTGDMIGGLLDRLSTEAGDRGYRIMTA